MSYDSIYKLSLNFKKIAQQMSVEMTDDVKPVLENVIKSNLEQIFDRLIAEEVTLDDWQINVAVDSGKNVKITSMPSGASLKEALEKNTPKPLVPIFGNEAAEMLQQLKITKQKFDKLLNSLSVQTKNKLSAIPSNQLPVNYSPLFTGLGIG